jgi:FkbM family methyltransferase
LNFAKKLFYSLRGALIWDNPVELLLDYHCLRRRDPIRLLKDGAQLIVDYKSSDMNAVSDIFIRGMYDKAIDVAVSQLEKGACLSYLNLGANVGAFDIRISQIAKKKGIGTSGVALEMNTTAFARLIMNLEINRLLHIVPIHAALSDEDGLVSCELAARDTGQSIISDEFKDSPTIHMIPSMKWETLWGEVAGNYDLVKVDIEGSEFYLLKNLSSYQANFFSNIVIETHSENIHQFCDQTMQKLGFELIFKDSSTEPTRISLWKKSK